MATLLGATIPIPAALEGLALEEENQALEAVILDLLSSVRMGTSLSASMERHPRLFPSFVTSMVRVGEESGALDKVLADLSELLEHEDETRGDALAAVAYPCFVLVLGAVTTFVLLAFVLPQIFQMLQGMVDVLPLPTRMLLAASAFFQSYWPWVLGGSLAAVLLVRGYVRSPAGALLWDAWKLRLPVVGTVFRAAALGRFARTLGILLRSGVSLLPALEIVRNTVRNRFVARSLVQVSEEARGGDSLALPLRKTRLFPPTLIQMVSVGEETGRLDEMLLKIAGIEERQVRLRSRTLISLLAPALILVVGTVVGFIVIALLLPIFRMSQLIQ
jgi:general secretion pathway protein F